MDTQLPEDSPHPPDAKSIESEVLRRAQASADRHPPGGSNDTADRLDAAEIAKLTAALAMLGGEAKMAHAAEASEPFRLGRFEVRGERGRGGFGMVLRAFDPVLQREVALKLPLPERLLVGDNPEEILREARMAAQLDHQGIVPVFETGQWGPVWYIASAYCPGPSLGEWLSSGAASLSSREAVQLAKQVCHAVQHAHSRGILHLDLKPDNILLKEGTTKSDRPTPLVTDFGLSHLTRSSAGSPSRIGGTRRYMAPEQIQGDLKNIGVAADVFALGSILQDLLSESGKSSAAHDATSKDLHAVVAKCRADDPTERYHSAQDLANDLDRYLQGEVLHARPVAWPIQTARWARRKPALAGVLMLLVLTLSTSALLFGLLWRRAEGYLADFKREAKRRQVADERLEASVQNLAWVAQKSRLGTPSSNSLSSPELASLRSFLLEMREWQSTQDDQAERPAGINAALDSLALVEGIESSTTAEFQQSYREGLRSWQQVLRADPTNLQWRRALAAHILTYQMRDPQRNWLAWRDQESGISPDVVSQVELPYAELLIELAAEPVRRRIVDPSYSMLTAAIAILNSQPAAEKLNQQHLLLTAYNLSAEAAKLLSLPKQVKLHRAAADVIVAGAGDPATCETRLALPIAETLELQSWERYRAGESKEAIQLLSRATEYARRSDGAGPMGFLTAAKVAHLLARKAHYLQQQQQPAESIVAYKNAVEVLESSLAINTARPRTIVARRGTLLSRLGLCYVELGDNRRATRAFEAAAQDFAEISLRQADSKGTWLVSIRTLQALGKLYALAGREADSRQAYNDSLARLATMGSFTRHPSVEAFTKVGKAAIAKLEEDSRSS